MRPAIFFSRLPDAAMEHPNRRLAPPDRNGVDTTETTISSTISTNSSSSSAAAAVPFTISSIPGHSHLTPNQRYHGHQDHPASSQHGRPTSMLLPHSTSLRSSRRTNLPVRQRPRISRDVRPSDPQAGLLQLLAALTSALTSSTAPSDPLRCQASGVYKAIEEVVGVCIAPIKRWWCPYHHAYHPSNANCFQLGAHSPCNGCGGGHSHVSCPHKRTAAERASSPGIEERHPQSVVRLPASCICTDHLFKFGDMWSGTEPDGKGERIDSVSLHKPATLEPHSQSLFPQCNIVESSNVEPKIDPVTSVDAQKLRHCKEIWHLLDEMHNYRGSFEPENQISHHKACMARLLALCGSAEAQRLAVEMYQLYRSYGECGKPVMVKSHVRTRDRMLLECQDLTVDNYIATWKTLQDSDSAQSNHVQFGNVNRTHFPDQHTAHIANASASSTSTDGLAPPGPRMDDVASRLPDSTSHRALVRPDNCDLGRSNEARGGGFSTSKAGNTRFSDKFFESHLRHLCTTATQTVSSRSVGVQCTLEPEVPDLAPSRFLAHGHREPARPVPAQPHRAAGSFVKSSVCFAVILVALLRWCSARCLQIVGICHDAAARTCSILHHLYAAFAKSPTMSPSSAVSPLQTSSQFTFNKRKLREHQFTPRQVKLFSDIRETDKFIAQFIGYLNDSKLSDVKHTTESVIDAYRETVERYMIQLALSFSCQQRKCTSISHLLSDGRSECRVMPSSDDLDNLLGRKLTDAEKQRVWQSGYKCDGNVLERLRNTQPRWQSKM